MNKSGSFYRGIILLLATVLSSSCVAGSFHLGRIKIGEVRLSMVGEKTPGRMSFTYRTFTGFESQAIPLEAGQVLIVSYGATMEKGRLSIEIQGPEADLLWSQVIEESQDGVFEIVAAQAGVYGLAVQGKDAGGGFEVAWQVK